MPWFGPAVLESGQRRFSPTGDFVQGSSRIEPRNRLGLPCLSTERRRSATARGNTLVCPTRRPDLAARSMRLAPAPTPTGRAAAIQGFQPADVSHRLLYEG
jgi:hypothetical protein